MQRLWWATLGYGLRGCSPSVLGDVHRYLSEASDLFFGSELSLPAVLNEN